ncbi:DJ-1/PfpI family protein [Agromyces protaetiae]|uniref:DJ-1/PfpI family protein n=1 Tax=Agromyces protaetiae TaxID=2509455 RepID=A0A4P6FCQ6_9MICO|nr:DJ-1/PfpI family protein [Agromyces protaetiae]QAY72743.1 DJ-1/PfpI family protein [Agromyces protaetiae]
MTEPLRIVSLLFPNVTQLDLTGPAQVFRHLPGTEHHLAWHTLDPVPTDAGFSIVPTTTIQDAPQADVLFVPGGQGAFELFDDAVALDFLRRQAPGARYVTSVCTGSFALGAAGLLDGRRATSHWGSLPLLEGLGAIPVAERVVRDGNVVTGAGVSSGIDFALTLAAEIFGPEVAKGVQLGIEYDPAPPFDAGAPGRPEANPAQVEATRASAAANRGPLVEKAAARLAERRAAAESAG